MSLPHIKPPEIDYTAKLSNDEVLIINGLLQDPNVPEDIRFIIQRLATRLQNLEDNGLQQSKQSFLKSLGMR